jgi:hypothetical protein
MQKLIILMIHLQISIDDNTPQYLDEYFVEESVNHQVKTIEISPGKSLNINNQLQPFQSSKSCRNIL